MQEGGPCSTPSKPYSRLLLHLQVEPLSELAIVASPPPPLLATAAVHIDAQPFRRVGLLVAHPAVSQIQNWAWISTCSCRPPAVGTASSARRALGRSRVVNLLALEETGCWLQLPAAGLATRRRRCRSRVAAGCWLRLQLPAGSATRRRCMRSRVVNLLAVEVQLSPAGFATRPRVETLLAGVVLLSAGFATRKPMSQHLDELKFLGCDILWAAGMEVFVEVGWSWR